MGSRSLRRWLNIYGRKTHRWLALIAFLPLLVITSTGLLLQMKKQWSWVQPPTERAAEPDLLIGFDQILAAAASVPEAEVSTWDHVDRLDVRPGRGVVKVRANNRWEVQVDTRTGEVISTAYRRSDLIEAIHDGSFFAGDWTKLGLFLPAAAALLILLITGGWLWYMPIRARKKTRLAYNARRAEKPVDQPISS
ncbi:MAG: PepSY domain-containing protein [Planctomycetota bacterium]